MEGISTTDPIVILKEEGSVKLSHNLLLRKAAHDTVRIHAVTNLQEINTYHKEIKRQRMVQITNTPCDYDGCRQNPNTSSGMYTNTSI